MTKESIKKSLQELPNLVKALKSKFKFEEEVVVEEPETPIEPEKPAEEDKFIDVKTTEGMILRYEGDTPQVGQDVLLVKEDGTVEPAPDGEHELEGGVKVTIQDGKFTMVGGIEEEEMTAEEKQAKIDEHLNALRKLDVVIEEMKKDNEKKDEAIEDLKEEVEETKETMKEMFKIVEKLAEQPSEKPTERKKDGFSGMSPATLNKDLIDFRADLKRKRLQTN